MRMVVGFEQMRAGKGGPACRTLPEISEASKGVREVSEVRTLILLWARSSTSLNVYSPFCQIGSDSESPGFIGCCDA